MSDTPETQPVEGAEILKLLKKIDAQGRANGESLTKCVALLSNIHARLQGAPIDDPGDILRDILGSVSTMQAVVEQAAPLLQSRAVRALNGGGVLGYLKGGRPGG